MNIIALWVALAYLLGVLSSWIAANYLGATYYSFGETNVFIRYAEWAAGLFSGGILISMLVDELNTLPFGKKIRIRYPVKIANLFSAKK